MKDFFNFFLETFLGPTKYISQRLFIYNEQQSIKLCKLYLYN